MTILRGALHVHERAVRTDVDRQGVRLGLEADSARN